MQNPFQVSLIKAIESGSIEEIRKLVIGRFDIDKPLIPLHDVQVNPQSTRVPFPSIRGPTPLVLAILYEKTQIIEYFIKDKNASLLAPVGGLLPIHYACIIGNTEIISLIITAKCSENLINKKNEFGYAPLHLAAANNHIKAVLLLLKYGAKVNPEPPTESGNTPLHVCMRAPDTLVAEALISYGANVNAKNKLGETPKDTANHFSNDVMSSFLDQVENQTANIRSFDALCKVYLDNDSAAESDTVKELTAQIKELTSRLEKLENH